MTIKSSLHGIILFGFVFTVIAVFINSCSNSNDDRKRFVKTYSEILEARENIQDSVKANTAVRNIIKKNGYTYKELKKKYFELASNPTEFVKLLDSLKSKPNK